MQVLRDEGVATHIGPEPCASVREDRGEASVGVCVGQPLSGDSYTIRSAEGVPDPEGNTGSPPSREAVWLRVVKDPGMRISLLLGNREISEPVLGADPRTAPGRPKGRSR